MTLRVFEKFVKTFLLTAFVAKFFYPAVALTKLLDPGCGSTLVYEKCINLGSANTIGQYVGDTDLVRYRRRPSFITYDGNAINADEPEAYKSLVQKRSVRFYVKVPAKQDYDVTVGLIEYANCDGNGNKIKLTIGNKKQTVFPVLDAGCETAVHYKIEGVRSSKRGRIAFKIKGGKPVTVATICVKRQLISTSTCSTPGCLTFDGCGNYAVINASLAIPGRPCLSNPSGFATLSLPDGVSIKHAVLQWAGSGHPKETSTNVTLNGKGVTSSLLYKNGEFEPYYGAIADVTEIVQEFGGNTDYVLSNIFLRPFHSCPQAHLAAWSLSVVYEQVDLPLSRINVCAENTKSTSQQLNFTVGCMVPNVPEVSARTTLIGIEGEQFTERLAINGKLIGFNVFNATSGERFDVITLNIGQFLKGETESLTYSFTNNRAHDSLILAVQNSYQTLPIS